LIKSPSALDMVWRGNASDDRARGLETFNFLSHRQRRRARHRPYYSRARTRDAPCSSARPRNSFLWWLLLLFVYGLLRD